MRSYYETCRLMDNDKHRHGYSKFYERFFERIKKSKDTVRILELGVRSCAGVNSFFSYFDSCEITGVDIVMSGKANCLNNEKPNFRFIEGNATAPRIIRELEKNNFDIIIDDASHVTGHQIFCFEKYYKLLNPGGIYIIEDLHTSYMKLTSSDEVINDPEGMSFRVKKPKDSLNGHTHDYGVDNPKSAVNYLKSIIDEVNCYGRASTKKVPDFEKWNNKEYASITFIKGSCIVEKFND